MIKADLHVHSNYSDGSDRIETLAEKIESAGIDFFALTDHDTIEGCIEIEKYLPERIKFIPGIELTCCVDSIKCHILGYSCNPYNKVLIDLIEKGKKLRRIKLEKRIEFLKDVWGIELTKTESDWLYSRKSPVKTHFANILVNRGLSDNNIDAMKKYLDGCKTGDTRFSGEEAVKAIIAAGGVPVWAHPLGGEGEKHISEDDFLSRFDIMKNVGIQGLECFYSRYSKTEIEFLVGIAKENGLVITGGSDYHGMNKDIPLGRLNTDDTPIDAEKLTILDRLFHKAF